MSINPFRETDRLTSQPLYLLPAKGWLKTSSLAQPEQQKDQYDKWAIPRAKERVVNPGDLKVVVFHLEKGI